jgi:hypothetical protein
MKTTDQIATEATKEICKHDERDDYNLLGEDGIRKVIKAAIEKAIEAKEKGSQEGA